MIVREIKNLSDDDKITIHFNIKSVTKLTSGQGSEYHKNVNYFCKYWDESNNIWSG